MAASVTTKDLEMMARCIELSRHAISQGEFPFACVVCKDGDILVETTNRVKRDTDVTKHAEMVAMSEAQKKIGKMSLSRCTLYTNVEPCAMCSYCIRETRISRVIYAIPSPIMGGFSQWKILQGKKLSTGIRKFSAGRHLSQAAFFNAKPKPSGTTGIRLSGNSSSFVAALGELHPNKAANESPAEDKANVSQIHSLCHGRASPGQLADGF